MLNKIKENFKNVGELKWVHVTGVIAMMFLFFKSGGMNFNDFTSWQLLGDGILEVLKSPASVIAFILALANQFNNTTK